MQDIEIINGGLEDLPVRPEGHGRTRFLGSSNFLHLFHGVTARELHLVDFAIAPNLHDHLL